MKNLHFFTLLAAGVFLAAAIATYQPATHTSGGSYSLTNSYSVAPVTGSLYPDASTLKAVRDTSLPVQSASPITHFPLGLTPAFSYTIGKVRLSGDEGTRPFPAELSVTELTTATLPPLDQGMVNVTDYAAGYRMLPDGMVFNGDISIVLPYDSTLLPAGFTPDDIVTYYYNVPSGRWMSIPRDSVSTAEALVYSKVNHFTDFINAIIKTPEMPETSAFTPTSIKELEAANPLEGLQLIQAPTANNNGTANLSYQLEIPAGRQGMQPNLALTYSSSGGNGWLGVGWDISVPSITVETRWGVPRYESEWESEVYIYGGEQLVTMDGTGQVRKMPHRTNQAGQTGRLPDGERFYARAGEAHDSIVRHDTTTQTYWWEVVDRNGMTSYYGAYPPGDTTHGPTRIGGPDGIARWALAATVDPNGNMVRYYYSIDYNAGAGGDMGKQLYLDSINYTGYYSRTDSTTVHGAYTVEFHRDSPRKDVVTNARYGFKEVTASKLCYATVMFNNSLVRTFFFITDYSRKSNYKTRLEHLIRVDDEQTLDKILYITGSDTCIPASKYENIAVKTPIVHYDFEYFDYPNTQNLFSDVVTMNLPDDYIGSTFLTPGYNATALGATKGKSWSLGGSASVGVGPDFPLTTVSLGGNFDYSQSRTSGTLTLIDLNGDGLADKVYKKGNEVYYRPQIRLSDTLFNFGSEVLLSGITDFLSESGDNISWGLQLSVAVASVNGSFPTSTSTTDTYFADINGDGLPDLVTPRGAMFNRLDGQGHPYFTPYNSIATTLDNNSSEQCVIVTSNDPCDQGIINDGHVSDSLACTMDWDILYSYNQKVWHDSIVSWKQQGYMCDTTDDGNALRGVRKHLVCGYVSGDPDMDAVRVWVAPRSGWVNIHSYLQLVEDTTESRLQSRYVDGVTASVQHSSGISIGSPALQSNHDDILMYRRIPEYDYSMHHDTAFTYVGAMDLIFFRLQSNENHLFDDVSWVQTITYLDSATAPDINCERRNEYRSDTDFLLSGEQVFKAKRDGGQVHITGVLSAHDIGDSVIVTAQLNNADYLSYNLSSAAGDTTIVVDTTFAVAINDEIFFEAHSPTGHPNWSNISFAPVLRHCAVFSDSIGAGIDSLVFHLPVSYSIGRNVTASDKPLHNRYRKLFGPLFRGWGQFGYNNLYADTVIKIQRLTLPPQHISASNLDAIDTSFAHIEVQNGIFNIEDLTTATANHYQPLSDSSGWVQMSPNMEYGAWLAYGNVAYVSADRMSNTRRILLAPVDSDEPNNDPSYSYEITVYDNVVPMPSVQGERVTTIRKQNKSKSENFGKNLGFIASVGTSSSYGENWVVSDYMDLNGDRYPDYLSEAYIQYTTPWGGISTDPVAVYDDAGISTSQTSSTGSTFGATYSNPKRMLGMNTKKSKFSGEGSGIGGSHCTGSDNTGFSYVDVNGDGLPDRVWGNGNVHLNMGHNFQSCGRWLPAIRSGKSKSNGANIGGSFNIAQASISGGLGINISENTSETVLMDVNGDGLPDEVTQNEDIVKVSYNLGNGSWTNSETFANGNVSHSTSFSESINLGVTVGFTVMSIVKVGVGVQTSPFNRTFSKDKAQLTDINGDGYPDIVTSDSEDEMRIRYNRAGKTNLLKKVTNFSGGSVAMDYTLSTPCYEQPQRQWNLASTTVATPAYSNIYPETLTTFEYRNPNYNRYERMDYGYDTVITRQHNTQASESPVYRYTVQGFFNQDFQKRGRKMNESVYGGDGHLYIETLYTTQQIDLENGDTIVAGRCPTIVYTSYEAEITRYYEQESSPQIVTEVVREYDPYHNVIHYENKGDTTRTDEYFSADISYRHGLGNNLISLPDTIVVRDKQNRLLQKRVAHYDTLGNLAAIEQFCGDSVSRYDFYHNVFGGVDSLRMPRNYKGQRMGYSYEYDNVVHAYPVRTRDVFGYSSSATYDYRFGKPLTTTDLNGNTMRYHYDEYGRLDTLVGPNEIIVDSLYTITMQYHPYLSSGDPCVTDPASYAVTSHYDIKHPNNPIQTILYCDGLGRLLQTKKDAEIEGVEQHIVSGKVVYDCFGRTVAQYYPVVEPLENVVYNPDSVLSTLTATTYDILDRPVKVKLPTNDSTRTSYGFGTDTESGKTYFRTTTTDPNGIAVTTLTGTRKQQVKTIAPHGAVTTFTYNALGQLLSSSDPFQHATTYTYDMLGRMVQRVHPDAGTDTYTYDGAGNVLKHATQVLTDSNKTIDYHYTYNRLDSIVYPYNSQNNVRYTYGDSTASYNQRGRIALLEDASGFRAYKYGRMGEVTEEHRTFVLPNESSQYSFKTQFEYDSWNRVQNITYPDGEVVRYYYNTGGMLRKVRGEKSYLNTVVIDTFIIVPPGPIFPKDTPDESTADNDTSGNGDRGLYQYYYYDYINDIQYNKYELKSGQWYGNGTHSHYSYDVLHRLDTLKLYDANGNALQDIKYNYDAVGNISSIQNNASIVNALGGRYLYTYKYDSLYRLTEGIVTVYAPRKTLYDTVRTTYYADGRIASKYQKGSRYVVNGPNFNQDVTYTYHTSQPHTADEIGGRNYTWDANGNMLSEVYYDPRATRIYSMLEWNEENRLQKADMPETHKCAYYLYDAGGERFYKNAGSRTLVYQNGHSNVYREYDDPVLYASPYVVATPEGYTKHYFAESERIASRIGEGSFANVTTHSVPDSLLVSKQSLTNNVAPDSILPNKFSYLLNPQSNWSAHHTTYWQHADHLGSASYITDTNGVGYQQLMYMPWGEPLLDRHRSNTSYDARYTFSGKERDEETGYSYFGSRYYNSSLSIWLSVDPMSDKYPSTSPYTYCANNPVVLKDPNGEDYEIVVDEESKTITIRATFYTDAESRETLQNGLDAWNKQSGIYSFQIGQGKKSDTYSINFELSIAKDKDGQYLDPASIPNGQRGSKYNQFFVTDNLTLTARGETEDGHICRVRSDAPLRTTIHEIGHTIGLGDFFGNNVMVSGGSDSNISSSNVMEILNHAGFVCSGTTSGGSPDESRYTNSIIDCDYHDCGWNGKFR